MNTIETSGLTYHFSSGDVVLKDINLAVPTGSIYGFLGPNGAGKTTTLRLLLGLLRKQQGEIQIFGLSFAYYREKILRRIGSSIESPSLYSHLTARENLSIWQTIYGCSERRLNEVLHLVGLENTGSKKAGQFSLGMKQRLGIAVALLPAPDLLLLDEPTNGLDPHGIIEIRDLLLTLNREQGTTILVSSHLLTEIERIISHVGIIHQGTLLFQGSLSQLQDKQRGKNQTLFDTSDNLAACELLTASGWTARIEADRVVVPTLSRAEAGDLNCQLIAQGLTVYGISAEKHDLEQIFLDLVRDGAS